MNYAWSSTTHSTSGETRGGSPYLPLVVRSSWFGLVELGHFALIKPHYEKGDPERPSSVALSVALRGRNQVRELTHTKWHCIYLLPIITSTHSVS